jgi:hypothetical protein
MFGGNSEMTEFYEERLAIAMHDGGLSYVDAHHLAMERTQKKWPLNANAHKTDLSAHKPPNSNSNEP